MKRLPIIAIFVLFIALCVSAAYWGMQLFKPPVRPVAAPSQVSTPEVRIDAAAGLFGGRSAAVAVASNYQLKGIVLAGKSGESIAILATDGKPAQSIRIDKEVAPGVTVKEVHAQYILLSEGGVTKRVELPEMSKTTSSERVDMAINPRMQQPVQPQMPPPAPPQAPQQVQPPAQPQVQPQISPRMPPQASPAAPAAVINNTMTQAPQSTGIPPASEVQSSGASGASGR